MLRSAITVWRRKANAAEVMIADYDNADDIRSVRNDMIASMTRVEEICETVMDMDPGHPVNIEVIAEKNQDIIRRIGARISDLKLEKSTIRTRHSSHGSTRSSRALQLEAAAKAAEIKARMKFSETKSHLLEEKMRLKQIAEKEEMRIEQLQKQLTLKWELAMNEAKLQAIAEEFGETVEPTGDLLRLLPEETHGVERFLAEQPVEAVPLDTSYSTHVSSVSFGVLPPPTFVDNPARDVL